ncbi:unnamed protein product [Closterium sp. Naga37s-1]|nr:unnamed protein product [Closterium sp. Naga37s-1]
MEPRRLLPVLALLLLSVSLLPLASSRRFPPQTKGPPKIPKQLDCSKTSWPEVLGMTGDAARTYIQSSVPQCNWNIEIIPSAHKVIMDYRDDRIRIFVDSRGIVQRIPIVG